MYGSEFKFHEWKQYGIINVLVLNAISIMFICKFENKKYKFYVFIRNPSFFIPSFDCRLNLTIRYLTLQRQLYLSKQGEFVLIDEDIHDMRVFLVISETLYDLKTLGWAVIMRHMSSIL